MPFRLRLGGVPFMVCGSAKYMSLFRRMRSLSILETSGVATSMNHGLAIKSMSRIQGLFI